MSAFLPPPAERAAPPSYGEGLTRFLEERTLAGKAASGRTDGGSGLAGTYGSAEHVGRLETQLAAAQVVV